MSDEAHFHLNGSVNKQNFIGPHKTLNNYIIEREICALPHNIMEGVMTKFMQRVDKCTTKENQHLKDIIFLK